MTDLTPVIAAYQRQYGRLRAVTVQQVRALWGRHGGLSDVEAERWLSAVVPVVQGAQAAAAGLVAAQVATLVRLSGLPPAPLVLDAARAASTRGVDPAEVYLRPVITARAKSTEVGLDRALKIAGERAETTAQTDVALAQRDSMAQADEQESRIVGYRRVLTGASCAFCATASTQSYGSADLMPIHNRCDCGVAPIIGSADPARVINRPLLDRLKQTSRDAKGDAKGYWSNRHASVDEDGNVTLTHPKVVEHGELGPTLVDPAHDVTTAGDLAVAS